MDVARYDQQIISVFRVVLANPLSTHEVLDQVLLEQRELAASAGAEPYLLTLKALLARAQ